MDGKEMVLFSNGLLILCEGYWEERGCTLIGAKVAVLDSDSPGNGANDAKDRTV